MAVRRGLRALVAANGLPAKLYVDNGAAYQAGRFHFACAQLDIELVHSTPYVSEGRGLVERFNRTAPRPRGARARRTFQPHRQGGLRDRGAPPARAAHARPAQRLLARLAL